MKRVGRPSNFTNRIAEAVRDGMALGHSLEASAYLAGISPRTAFHWIARHPEFLQAVEEGRAAALLFWERRAIDMAHGAPGNAALVTLALRNRSHSPSGWGLSASARLEVSGPGGLPVQIEPPVTTIDARALSMEERSALRRALTSTFEIENKMRHINEII